MSSDISLDDGCVASMCAVLIEPSNSVIFSLSTMRYTSACTLYIPYLVTVVVLF